MSTGLKVWHKYGDATYCEIDETKFCYFGDGHDAFIKFSDVPKISDFAWDVINSYADPAPSPEDRFWEKGQAGWIYVLEGGGYYKIGRTTDLAMRLRQISPKLPFKVTLQYQMFCPSHLSEIERGWHEQFADKRINGEWFQLDQEDLAWIEHRTHLT